MDDNDLMRLHHSLEAAQEALRFANGKTRDSLTDDRILTPALVKETEIVGEANEWRIHPRAAP